MDQEKKNIIVFCLFKYFPYGGLQRDFMRVAAICAQLGFGIRVYTISWQGSIPSGFDVQIVPVKALSNHMKTRKFSDAVARHIDSDPADLVVGFNKMAGLDVYFASDNCFAEKCSARSVLYRLTSRAHTYLQLESEVFGPDSKTHILLISPRQKEAFKRFYSVADDRMTLLPLGVDKKFFDLEDSAFHRQTIRKQLGISESDWMLLQVGSSFKTKGVDRVIRAIAALPINLRQRTVYVVVGSGKEKPFKRLAQKLGVGQRVLFVGIRQDVERFMKAADLLVHPARTEAAGMTLVESIAVALPVLCSGTCGYAPVVEDCQAGLTLSEPFEQSQFNAALAQMLDTERLRTFAQQAKARGNIERLSGMAEKAAEIIIKQSL